LARYGPNPGNLQLNETLEKYGAVNRDDDNTGLTTKVLFGSYDAQTGFNNGVSLLGNSK
jgi:hypothetical protein